MYKKRFFALILMAISALSFSGCAHIFPPPGEQPQARQILERLRAGNAGLERFKGLARVRMETDSQVVSGRIAMAAALPDKLRVEWLNVMGQPLISLCGDGQTITIFLRVDQKVYHLRQSPRALEQVIHIPIGIEALQQILTGGLPVPADAVIQLKKREDDTDLFVLKNRWHSTVATLTVDRTTSRALSMTSFDSQGAMQYEIRWLQWHRNGPYLLPLKMVFESESRQRLTLTMDRFWPNADVPPSTFTMDIPPSGS